MQLSKRCEYGLRALIDIALAKELGKARVPVQDLVTYEKIPTKFLEQILVQLKKAGYLSSHRGPSGGYSLAKDPSKIFFGDVIRQMNGPLAPILCASKTAYEPCSCPSEKHCGLHLLMLELRSAISQVLDRTSLSDMVKQVRSKLKNANVKTPLFGGS